VVILTDSDTDTHISPTSPLSPGVQGIFTSGSGTRTEGHSNGWLSEDDDEIQAEDTLLIPVEPASVGEVAVAPPVIPSPTRHDRDTTLVYTRKTRREPSSSATDVAGDTPHPTSEDDHEPKRARDASQSEREESSRAPMDRAAVPLAPILTARIVELERQLTTLRQEFQVMSQVSEATGGRLMTMEDVHYLDHDALMQMHFRITDLEQGQADLRQEMEALKLRKETAKAGLFTAQQQAAVATERADAALAAVGHYVETLSFITGIPMFPFYFP
jgi:hypothetical protein